MSLRLCSGSLEEVKQSEYFLPILKSLWEESFNDEDFDEWLESLGKEEIEEVLDIIIVEGGK